MAQGIAARVGSQGELDKELALAVAFLASHAIKTSGRPVATANTIADAVEETMRELMLARAARGVQH
jgi:hypothetical protein